MSTNNDNNDDSNDDVTNNRLVTTRDSIFINRKRRSCGDSDDEDQDELIRNTELNRGSSHFPMNNSQVRFKDIPKNRANDNGSGRLNPTFQNDDDDNGMDDQQPENNYKRKSVQFKPDQQNNKSNMSYLNQVLENEDDDNDEQSKKGPKPQWDTFKSIPLQDEDSSTSSDWVKMFLKIAKLLSYGFSMILVILFGVVSKLLFHLMANMTRVDKKVLICNSDVENDKLNPTKHYYSVLGLKSEERIVWVWMLYFVLIAPDVFLFIRCIHHCLFKKYTFPKFSHVLIIFISNTAEVIGISMFAYLVLPSLDVVVGLMVTNSFFFIPSLFLFLRSCAKNGKIMAIVYLIAFIFQFISIIVWPMLISWNDQLLPESDFVYKNHDDTNLCWIIPLCTILISLGYWENFLGKHDDENSNGFMKLLYKIKRKPVMDKYAIYLFVTIWKFVLYLLTMLLIQSILARYYHSDTEQTIFQQMVDMMDTLFTNFAPSFANHPIKLTSNSFISDASSSLNLDSDGWTPIIVGLLQIISAFFCYQTINFACKICIQNFGFALPINLILPLCVSLADLASQITTKDPCWFPDRSAIFEYTFFNTHYSLFDHIRWINYLFYATWVVTFISQIIITSHIWKSSKERLASSDQLFMLPLYTTSFIDQSLMLNRRITETWLDDENAFNKKKKRSHSGSDDSKNDIRIYACATVWHETADELFQMLKSIMRMDKDRCCRFLAVKYMQMQKHDVDYYDFETHLFVDDAFTYGPYYSKENSNDLNINEYVETLIQVLDEAAQNVHQRFLKIKPPEIYVTPYGGRVEWTLPGGTKLIAHLKDKAKIRHRKRWSQVMYMYYLLGYRIYHKEPERHESLTKNTYLLALDGDINFQPEAVLLLVDLMKKDERLGAACGRVHPVGSGPMAWYQKFEYAISHWLQKATEHVFGCVLCSPGCFSLFRASALCDTNVMNRYTTKPTEAIHYVQYDQGEDRWLCTLLLQQGWKVEYSAASDSFTHCPEGFDEFYIQRRRWTPSTMANIIDLLKSYKYTVQKNDSISSLYMLYQASLMLGTILSPGTIFLMLVGSTNNAFGLKNEYSFFINFIPVLIFVLVCFFYKTETQILVAQVFSTFYAMLMLAVLVSTGIEMYNDSVFSPSVIFFVGMLTMFIIAALIHPQEILCLIPVIIYLLAIPSMYLLLTLYSVINLNIVTWGTRENPQQQQQVPVQVQSAKANQEGFLSEIGRYLNRGSKWDFKCLCCAQSKNEDELYLLRDIKDSLTKVTIEMSEIKNQYRTASNLNRRRSTYFAPNGEGEPLLTEVLDEEEVNDLYSESEVLKQKEEELEILRRPRWIYNINLKYGHVKKIEQDEDEFWKSFIKKYLKPLDKDKIHEEKVKIELIGLRNRAFFALGIINIIFVLFVYLMQLHKDIFGFEIPISKMQNGTKIGIVDGEERDDIPVYIERKVQMDPVGFILIIFFGSIMFIQFIGMLLHRIGTLTHLLAFTDLNFFQAKATHLREKKQMDKNALQIVWSVIEWEDPNKSQKESEYEIFDLEKNFEKAYKIIMASPETAIEIVKNSDVNPSVSRKALGKELFRRSSVYIQRPQDETSSYDSNEDTNDSDNDNEPQALNTIMEAENENHDTESLISESNSSLADSPTTYL